MHPRNNFENLHAVMAILEFFEVSRKFCLLFDHNSECFAKYDAFCSHIFDYACARLITIKEVQNYGKFV